MGVPTPETMAKLQAEQAEKMKQEGYIKEDEPLNEPVNVFPFGNIVSGTFKSCFGYYMILKSFTISRSHPNK